MYEWLLFLHVLSAFLLVGAMTFFWAVILATRPRAELVDAPAFFTLSRVGGVAIMAGTVGTLVFGIWLAIYLDAYEILDGWIVGSLVLWVVGTAAGYRAGRDFTPVGDAAPAPEARRRGTILHAVSSLAALVILVLMIWKPGA